MVYLEKAEQNQNWDFHCHVPFSKSYQKLKVPDQPQSVGEKSYLTRDITQLLV